MNIKSSVVFETNLLNIVRKEFDDPEKVKEFLKKFDFTKIYTISGKRTSGFFIFCDRPQSFKLGIKFSFDLGDKTLKSEPVWGLEAFVGRSIKELKRVNNDYIYEIESPFDRRNHFEKYEVNKKENEELIVINQRNLEQVYPPITNGKSLLDEFLEKAFEKKYIIKER